MRIAIYWAGSAETTEELATTIRKALQNIAPEKLHPCTNCGMAPLAHKVARDKLNALTAGASIVRNEIDSL